MSDAVRRTVRARPRTRAERLGIRTRSTATRSASAGTMIPRYLPQNIGRACEATRSSIGGKSAQPRSIVVCQLGLRPPPPREDEPREHDRQEGHRDRAGEARSGVAEERRPGGELTADPADEREVGLPQPRQGIAIASTRGPAGRRGDEAGDERQRRPGPGAKRPRPTPRACRDDGGMNRKERDRGQHARIRHRERADDVEAAPGRRPRRIVECAHEAAERENREEDRERVGPSVDGPPDHRRAERDERSGDERGAPFDDRRPVQ